MADPKRMRNITFNTPKVVAKVRKVKAQAWRIVAKEMNVMLHDKIKRRVGIRRGKRGGIIKVRSKPGEPPRRDTGYLYGNTEVIYRNGKVVVRTPNYGGWLEGGTSRMRERPFVRPTISSKSKWKSWNKRAREVMRTLAGKGPIR